LRVGVLKRLIAVVYILYYLRIYIVSLYLRIYNKDKNAPVSQTLTHSEIIDAVLGRKLNESEDSDDSNGSVDEENKMTRHWQRLFHVVTILLILWNESHLPLSRK
jgi:hypothetical protein